MKITHSIKSITPEVATKILETVDVNRKVNSATVAKYALDMKNKSWLLTGEPIIISDTGKLLDGQHRLWAIVESGTTQDMLVIHGISDDALWAIGSARARSLGQILQMHGYPNSLRLAAAARCMMILEGQQRTVKPSVATTVTCLAAHPGIEWVMSQPGATTSGPYSTGGVIAAFALLYEKHPLKAAKLWEEFSTGADLKSGDPFLTLRDFLLKHGSGRRGKNGTETAVSVARRTLTAIAYKLRGDTPLAKSYDSEVGVKMFLGHPKKRAA